MGRPPVSVSRTVASRHPTAKTIFLALENGPAGLARPDRPRHGKHLGRRPSFIFLSSRRHRGRGSGFRGPVQGFSTSPGPACDGGRTRMA